MPLRGHPTFPPLLDRSPRLSLTLAARPTVTTPVRILPIQVDLPIIGR
jgi:hypothetical protein